MDPRQAGGLAPRLHANVAGPTFEARPHRNRSLSRSGGRVRGDVSFARLTVRPLVESVQKGVMALAAAPFPEAGPAWSLTREPTSGDGEIVGER